MRGPRTAGIVAVVALALTGLQAHVAQASTPAHPAAGSTDLASAARTIGTVLDTVTGTLTGARHCAIGLHAVSRGTSPSAVPAPERHCYSTFSAAVSYATDGRVKLPADATPRSASGVLAASSSPLIAIEYDSVGYSGDSRVIYGDGGSGCYAGRQYYVTDMRDIDFDDRVNSVRLYSNCLGRHYVNLNLSGSSYLCDASCSTLGSYNNRTTSIKYF